MQPNKHIAFSQETLYFLGARMNACINLREIAEMTRGEIEQTVRAAERYNPSVTASCEEFYRQVRSLESSVMCAYKIAVCLAKRTTDLRELCDIWKTASEICDSILKASSVRQTFCTAGFLWPGSQRWLRSILL